MAAVIDDGQPSRLGSAFWVLWLGALGLVTASYGIGVWLGLGSALAIGALTITFTCAVWGLSILPWYLRRRRGAESRMRAPVRRYLKRFMPAMVIYVIVLMAAAQVNAEQHPKGWLAWALAIAPVIPVLFAIRAIGLLYKEQDDEYERARLAKAYVWATCATLATCMAWGLLETFGLVPHIWMWAVMPLWAVFLIMAQVLIAWGRA